MYSLRQAHRNNHATPCTPCISLLIHCYSYACVAIASRGQLLNDKHKLRKVVWLMILVALVGFLVVFQLITSLAHLKRHKAPSQHNRIQPSIISILTLNNSILQTQPEHFRSLYETEEAYFHTLTHYNDDWTHLTNTSWTSPRSSANFSIKASRWKWCFRVINYPIIPFSRSSHKHRSDDKLTLVSHTALEHLQSVYRLAQHWDSIISLSVYMPYETNTAKRRSNMEQVNTLWDRIERNTEAKLDVHLLFETEPLDVFDAKHFTAMYPVNHLRNMALQAARTPFVLVADIHLVPSENFIANAVSNYAHAQRVLRQTLPAIHEARDRNIALVIPTFAALDGDVAGLSKDEVAIGFEQGEVVRYVAQNGTDYSKWIALMDGELAGVPYEVEYRWKYEPYIVMKRTGLRRYDARFRGLTVTNRIYLNALDMRDRVHWMVAPDCFMYSTGTGSQQQWNTEHESDAGFMSSQVKQAHEQEWLDELTLLATLELAEGHDATGRIIN